MVHPPEMGLSLSLIYPPSYPLHSSLKFPSVFSIPKPSWKYSTSILKVQYEGLKNMINSETLE